MTTIDDGVRYENTVKLRGILASAPTIRVLPSGNELCAFRLNVRRSPSPSRASRVSVDSIDCAASSAGVRKVLSRAQAGEMLELTGRLQRRFWRSPGGVASRYEVEVTSLRREPASRRSPGQRSAG